MARASLSLVQTQVVRGFSRLWLRNKTVKKHCVSCERGKKQVEMALHPSQGSAKKDEDRRLFRKRKGVFVVGSPDELNGVCTSRERGSEKGALRRSHIVCLKKKTGEKTRDAHLTLGALEGRLRGRQSHTVTISLPQVE